MRASILYAVSMSAHSPSRLIRLGAGSVRMPFHDVSVSQPHDLRRTFRFRVTGETDFFHVSRPWALLTPNRLVLCIVQ